MKHSVFIYMVSHRVNTPISSQQCYVTMETIWKNTGGFVDGRTILNLEKWLSKFDDDRTEMVGEPLVKRH